MNLLLLHMYLQIVTACGCGGILDMLSFALGDPDGKRLQLDYCHYHLDSLTDSLRESRGRQG